MLKTFMSLILLLTIPAASWAQVAKELVGKYQMDVQGGDTLELRADGTASFEGENTKWAAKGNQLQIGADVMSYTLQGDRLVMTMGIIPLVWKKISGGSGSMSPMAKAAAKAGAAAAPATSAASRGDHSQDEQARQLLTSSAWCSFTYNKVSGTSTTRKVVFRQDGVMTVIGGAETYSSGYGGTFAGQSSSAGMMLWKVDNLRLLIDQRDGAGFQDIGLTSTKNSNGYPILHAEGREYSMCR